MLIHFPVQWKSTQHYKATIPQLKKNTTKQTKTTATTTKSIPMILRSSEV